jgi:hypothetical protein
VGSALRRTLAEGAGADGGWQHRTAHGGDAAGGSNDALNAKDNFHFERKIFGWRRHHCVLDLRRKR